MKKYEYTNLEIYSPKRSPECYLPNDCKYCAYGFKPSSTGYNCSVYCKSFLKINKNK